MPIDDVLGTADHRVPSHGSLGMSRRQVLVGLAGLPAGLVLASCTSGAPRPAPSGSTTTSKAQGPAPGTTPPDVDGPALVTAAEAALVLIASYERTLATHPTLEPVLAPYAADHDVHLEALGERVALPTTAPAVTTAPPATSGPTGPTSTPASVPADPASAREALARAEQIAGDEVAAAAREAREGEAARLLASIAASRAVHALLLAEPA